MCQAMCWMCGINEDKDKYGCQVPGSHEVYILEAAEEKGENPCRMLTAGGTCDKGHQRGAKGARGRPI